MGGLWQEVDERLVGGGGLVQRVAGGLWEKAGDRFELGPGEGERVRMGLRVAHPDQDRGLAFARRQSGARRPENHGPRRVADVVLVKQATCLAVDHIRSGVEGKQAEHAGRDKDDADGLQLAKPRRDGPTRSAPRRGRSSASAASANPG